MMSVTNSSAPSAHSVTEAQTRSKPKLLLVVMLLTVFLSVANIFIVNVATPSIQRGLHAGFSEVQFVIASYTLAYAIALIIGGRFGDRFGRKRMLLIGVAGFTVSSFLCAIAPGVSWLIVFRIAQGLSAALMAPQILSLIQANYAPEQRAAIFGLYGAAQGIAASSGQLIGGLLLRWNPFELDWRTVFFFSVPVGLLILCMLPSINESKNESHAKLDWIGAAGAAAGLLMLIYPLVQGPKEGWPLSIVFCLILSVPVLAAFVWHERRVARAGGSPFINVELFKQKSFTFGMLVILLLLCSQSAYFLVSAYFLQIGLGFTALKAGLFILPMGIGYFLASLYSAKLIARFGPHVMTWAAAMTCAGYLLLALSVHWTGITVQGYEWIPALALLGLAQGAIAAPLTNAILSKVRSSDIGSASGLVTTGIQVAFAIGIALIGILFLNTLGQHANTVSVQLAPQLQMQLSGLKLPAEQNAAVVASFQSCYDQYAHSADPTAVPSGCGLPAGSPEINNVMFSGLKQANAYNYAFSYELCLYVLAICTAALLPLVYELVRKNNRKTA
ncbi:MFS transporter [Paenibacillus thalictri]|uniref:MFS transporter n=1 Tax=Paenibacillus thalictri TaxID=2527873 RepID=A0A4Q9DP80_9BACL|nr:MFS transporter [Paenibacillus thalictri]TBL77881.1 MFS transporter [Paenibacillus thalictri]